VGRSLPAALDQIQLSRERRDAWRIEVFDLKSSTGDTIGDIVLGLTLEAITGPRDFTGDVKQFHLLEVASDFATTGVAVPSITLQVIDPNGEFDPVENPGGNGRWLRRGNAVRLYEGDSRVDSSLWPCTFTGKLVGQYGLDLNRTGGGRAIGTMKGLGREADYLNVPITTDDYSAGTTLKSIGLDIAQADMGLDIDEIDWVNWGAQVNGHLSLQFVELPPLVSIANLMMIDGMMPRFDGEGKLTQTLGLVTQNADRVYTNLRQIVNIVRPFSEANPANSVLVIGLDAETTEISQPAQDLTELHVTTGYFTQDEAIEVFWSEDQRSMANGISLKIIKSANGGLSLLGGGETFTTLPAPIGTGTVGATLTISTGFAPYIVIFLTVIYVTLAAVPDLVAALIVGETISVGRIIQAIALAAILMLMTKIGKGQYIFSGEPFENVYLELRGQAELEGLTTETRKQITISNQVLQTQADVDSVARNTLFRQQTLAATRSAEMIADLALTPDDVFEVPGPKRYQIQTYERTGTRGSAGTFATAARLTLSELTAVGFE
jgi:hypothetical protein